MKRKCFVTQVTVWIIRFNVESEGGNEVSYFLIVSLLKIKETWWNKINLDVWDIERRKFWNIFIAELKFEFNLRKNKRSSLTLKNRIDCLRLFRTYLDIALSHILNIQKHLLLQHITTIIWSWIALNYILSCIVFQPFI